MFDFRDARDRVFGVVRTTDGAFRGVIRRPELRRSERALLLALIEFAPNIEPSIATIGAMLESDEKTVRRLLSSLEAKGYLRIVVRSGHRSHYELTIPQIPVPPETPPRPETDPPANSTTPPHGARGTPPHGARGTPGMVPYEADNISRQEKQRSAPQSAAGSFALESPRRKDSKALTTKSRASKPKTEHGEAYKAVVARYFEAFQRQHGREPAFDGADGTAVKRLLAKVGDAAEACRRIDNAFASWRAGSVTIRDIASKPDAFASAEAPRKANGQVAHVQRDGSAGRTWQPKVWGS